MQHDNVPSGFCKTQLGFMYDIGKCFRTLNELVPKLGIFSLFAKPPPCPSFGHNQKEEILWRWAINGNFMVGDGQCKCVLVGEWESCAAWDEKKKTNRKKKTNEKKRNRPYVRECQQRDE